MSFYLGKSWSYPGTMVAFRFFFPWSLFHLTHRSRGFRSSLGNLGGCLCNDGSALRSLEIARVQGLKAWSEKVGQEEVGLVFPVFPFFFKFYQKSWFSWARKFFFFFFFLNFKYPFWFSPSF